MDSTALSPDLLSTEERGIQKMCEDALQKPLQNAENADIQRTNSNTQPEFAGSQLPLLYRTLLLEMSSSNNNQGTSGQGSSSTPSRSQSQSQSTFEHYPDHPTAGNSSSGYPSLHSAGSGVLQQQLGQYYLYLANTDSSASQSSQSGQSNRGSPSNQTNQSTPSSQGR